jgi:hypothetical protein
MPIEIRELNIRAEVSPRQMLTRIVSTAFRGPAGVNAAVRGVRKLAATEEGAELLKEMTEKFTLFNGSGTPVRAGLFQAWPAKWKGFTLDGKGSGSINPHEFSFTGATRLTEAKALAFVKACIGG